MTNRGAETTVLPQLERLLTKAATRQIEPSMAGARGRRIRRRGSRAGIVAFAGLIVAGTAMAATGVWNPSIGDRSPAEPPTRSETAVPTALSEELGVLRRVPTGRDHSAPVEATLHGVSKSVVAGVRPTSIRYLGPGVKGEATILLAVEEADAPGAAAASAEPGSPARWSSNDPLCVYRPIVVGGEAPAACFHLAQILAGEAFGVLTGPDGSLTRGLVPDGVPSVLAHFSNRNAKRVAVKNNYFEVAGTVNGISWRDFRHGDPYTVRTPF